MKKVILIWEEVPEETFTYVLNVSDEEIELLNKCHGHYINNLIPGNAKYSKEEIGAALKWLNEYLMSQERIPVKAGPIDAIDCSKVFISGFIL